MKGLSKGFTLIELLIVMAVIAILIAVAVPSFRGMQQEARKAKAQGDLKVLKVAIESYYKNNAMMPVETTNTGATISTNWQSVLTAASPKVLDAVLLDPFSSGGATQYRLVLSANAETTANYYMVWSLGIDGTTAMTAINNGTGVVTGAVGDDVAETNGVKP